MQPTEETLALVAEFRRWLTFGYAGFEVSGPAGDWELLRWRCPGGIPFILYYNGKGAVSRTNNHEAQRLWHTFRSLKATAGPLDSTLDSIPLMFGGASAIGRLNATQPETQEMPPKGGSTPPGPEHAFMDLDFSATEARIADAAGMPLQSVPFNIERTTAGTYKGADLHNDRGTWIASVHATRGSHGKDIPEFEQYVELLANAPAVLKALENLALAASLNGALLPGDLSLLAANDIIQRLKGHR